MDEGLPHQVKKSDVMSPFFIMQEISFRYFLHINKVHLSDRIGEADFVHDINSLQNRLIV